MGLPFTSSHAKKRDQLVAIDLGAKTTKAVHVQRRGDGWGLVNYSIVDTPASEKPLTSEQLAEHFKEVIRSFGGRVKHATVALGVNDTVFKQVEVPLMPIPDLRLMLKYNSKTYLQQDLNEHVFDCYYSLAGFMKASEPAKGGAPAKQKAFVSAARKQLIDNCQSALRSAGLQADQVVPSVIGPVNAFEVADPESFKRDVVALVELGFKSTAITIVDGGEIALNRVLAIGGDRLTCGLAESMGITYQEAENLKVGMPTEVMQNLEPYIHPLGRELRASIDYFENHHDKAVAKVFLSGGAARSDLIVQTLQAELMVPCEVWTPIRALQAQLPPEKVGDLDAIAPQLAVAMGAAVASF